MIRLTGHRIGGKLAVRWRDKRTRRYVTAIWGMFNPNTCERVVIPEPPPTQPDQDVPVPDQEGD